jgi:two-component system sensor histidine kinase DesK
VHELLDFRLCAHVDASRGFVEQEDLGLLMKETGERDLLLVATGELADRLVDVSPERARAEIADIQRLSRDALADVRRTVDGVRELSLPAELARARSALQAAEITADLPGSTDHVPSDVRELFAWTLREGVTNVVRHSAASRCTVTLADDRITIEDDGRVMRSADASALRDGHGLSGLRERAAAEGAHVVVETPPSGGFRLSVVAARTAEALGASTSPATREPRRVEATAGGRPVETPR